MVNNRLTRGVTGLPEDVVSSRLCQARLTRKDQLVRNCTAVRNCLTRGGVIKTCLTGGVTALPKTLVSNCLTREVNALPKNLVKNCLTRRVTVLPKDVVGSGVRQTRFRGQDQLDSRYSFYRRSSGK